MPWPFTEAGGHCLTETADARPDGVMKVETEWMMMLLLPCPTVSTKLATSRNVSLILYPILLAETIIEQAAPET